MYNFERPILCQLYTHSILVSMVSSTLATVLYPILLQFHGMLFLCLHGSVTFIFSKCICLRKCINKQLYYLGDSLKLSVPGIWYSVIANLCHLSILSWFHVTACCNIFSVNSGKIFTRRNIKVNESGNNAVWSYQLTLFCL